METGFSRYHILKNPPPGKTGPASGFSRSFSKPGRCQAGVE
jgi:hypothetical protein